MVYRVWRMVYGFGYKVLSRVWCVAGQGASLLYGVCSLRWEASPGALCAYGVWGRCCVVCVVYGVAGASTY
jgi:hypothetical protein